MDRIDLVARALGFYCGLPVWTRFVLVSAIVSAPAIAVAAWALSRRRPWNQ